MEGERARLEEIATLKSELAEQLQWALDHRVTIEQAKGILMEPVAAELIKGQPLPAPVPSGTPKRRRQRSH